MGYNEANYGQATGVSNEASDFQIYGQSELGEETGDLLDDLL